MDIQSMHYGLIISSFIILVFAVTKTKEQDTFYFDPAPIDQDVVEGDDVLLQCDVSNRRHIQFIWEMNNKRLPNTSRRYQEDSDLRILRVDRALDSGAFRCTATNYSTGVSLRSREARLDILWIDTSARVDLKQPKAADLAQDADITLKCEAEGNGAPNVEWYRNNIRLFPSDRYRYLKNAKLKVIGVTVEDNGVYSCVAQNLAGSIRSHDNYLLNIPGQGAAVLDTDTFTRYTLARQGDDTVLHCHYENAIITEWYHGEARLSNSSNNKYSILPNGTLVIHRVQTGDAGSYQCLGLSDSGPDQTFVSELQIAYLSELTDTSFQPRPSPDNSPIVVPEKKKIEILCITPDGLPAPSQRWENIWGMTVLTTGRIRAESGILTISDAEREDSGNYTCVANNTAGMTRRNVWVVVSVAPTWKQQPLSDRVMEGRSLTFNCQYFGSPYPVTSISWKKGDFPVDLSHPRYHVDQKLMTLTINNVHLIDEDDYVCVVTTKGHPPLKSPNAHLYVEKRLKFRPRPVSTQLDLGRRSEVDCRADARSPPRIHWIKEIPEGFTSDNPGGFPPHVSDINGLLVFDGAQYSDAGNYTCIAQTDTEKINITINIQVVVKPQIRVKPKNTTAYEGYPAILHCIAEGDPQPKIEWDKNNVLGGFSEKRFRELSNGSLYITEVYMDDVGKYGCTAGNSGGFQREEVYLHVARADGPDPRYIGGPGAEEADNFNMMRTIIIAVCCAVAYLAIVVGLTVYCSLRMMKAKNLRKQRENETGATQGDKAENGTVPTENTELMDKKERDSSSVIKSDLDARSHVSGVSSQQSHSTGGHSYNSQASSSRGTGRQGTLDRLAFPRHQLQTLGMLGKGHYGDVFLAKAHGIRGGEQEEPGDTLVVIKSLLSREEHHQEEFRREIDTFSKLSHEHVAKLLGICCEMEPRFLITEYSDWGDLKQYLWATRKDNGRRLRPLTPAQKASMCCQVASAMEHFWSRRMIHRDLAARNVLLSSTLDLKVSCLGLCRDVYAAEYFPFHQQLIPLRWMSPEAVLEDEYSSKSDVWAFGVLIWEVFTLGDLPLRERSDEEVLKGLKAGGLGAALDRPIDCPLPLYDMVVKCTQDCPKDRPSFGEIVASLGDIQVDSDV